MKTHREKCLINYYENVKNNEDKMQARRDYYYKNIKNNTVQVIKRRMYNKDYYHNKGTNKGTFKIEHKKLTLQFN